MSIAEIIAELPRLTSAELAEVQAKLKELVDSPLVSAPVKPVTDHPALGIWKDRTDLPDGRSIRISTPRLAHPEQSKDFSKQIVELPPDAKL